MWAKKKRIMTWRVGKGSKEGGRERPRSLHSFVLFSWLGLGYLFCGSHVLVSRTTVSTVVADPLWSLCDVHTYIYIDHQLAYVVYYADFVWVHFSAPRCETWRENKERERGKVLRKVCTPASGISSRNELESVCHIYILDTPRPRNPFLVESLLLVILSMP